MIASIGSSRPLVALVHGWGLSPSIWDEVAHHLPNVELWRADLGFFGDAQLHPPRRPTLAVGHSLGTLMLLTVWNWACPILAISGFPRFTASACFPHGVPERVLERMAFRFAQSPDVVLSEFWSRIGAPEVLQSLRPAPLAEGLELLRSADGRASIKRICMAVAAQDDPLLPLALYRESFGEILKVLPSGGHLLPLTRPREIAQAIGEVLIQQMTAEGRSQ